MKNEHKLKHVLVILGPRFPQIDFTFESARDAFAGELDSMHINVYTNNFQPSTPYPVLVWIHGGGFRTGSALTDIYGPDYFMEQDVVVVTFNYRLHAFGFLSLDDRTLEIPGKLVVCLLCLLTIIIDFK